MIKYIPHLYYVGQMSLSCNSKVFAEWFLWGVLHSAIVFFIPVYSYYRLGITLIKGYPEDMWTMTITSFTACVIVALNKLIIVSRLFNIYHFMAFAIPSYGFYYTYLWAS